MTALTKLADISISGAQIVLAGLAYLQIAVFAVLVIGVLAVVLT